MPGWREQCSPDTGCGTSVGAWGASLTQAGEAPGTAQDLLHQQGVRMGAQTSDLWNRKQPGGGWKWDSCRRR